MNIKFASLSQQQKKAFVFAAKIIVAAAILFFLVRKISLQEIISVLAKANVTFLLSAFLLLLPNLFCQIQKWGTIVRQEKSHAKLSSIIYSLLVGMTLGLMTPGRVGEFGRSFFIKDADWARLMGFTLIDKLIAMSVIYAFGIIGLAHFISVSLHPLVWLPIIITILLFILFLFVFLLRPDLLKSVLARFSDFFEKHPLLHKFVNGIEMATPQLSRKLLFYSLLQNIIFCSQLVILVRAFSDIPILSAYYAVFAIMMTKTLLPISFGDLGIRESATIYFFSRLGVIEAAAFNASILLFLINVFLPSLAGALIFLAKRWVPSE